MDFEKAINAMSGYTEQDYLDISHITPNNKVYGGLACTKIGVTLDGIDYLVKYPTSTEAKNFKNTSQLYLNNSVSEYLGSKIFKLFGFI